jgi:polyisoprenoid-binding protein YceI
MKLYRPLLALALAGAVAVPAHAADSYAVDPYHTYVHFEVEHLGMSKMRGRFDKVTGRFTLDPAARTGTVEIVIHTASITTGDNDKGSRPRSRDEHLRSPDFFNVAEFPTMTFKSTQVVFKGDTPATIEGNVTLLGVTRPVTFAVEGWKCGANVMSKREMCGANASASIKRSDFGMKYGIPAVGDEQKLWIEMEGYKE